ncbi:MAG: hypothetical protein HZC43_03510 [Nitrosomonadales bacterium]|nr:hypothetical protein [Nitrosomonadales bacterium]
MSGTGGITNMVAVPFNATTGVAGAITYTGFTAADTTTITGVAGFNDGAKTSGAYTFANATGVTGTGAISNVTTSFNDGTATSASGITYTGFGSVVGDGTADVTNSATFLTSASGITYTGFGSVVGDGTADVTNSATFLLTGANAGTGASGLTYTAFDAASNTTAVTGAVGFDDGAKSNQGITFAAATGVTGTGAIINVLGVFDIDTLISTASSIIDYSVGFTSAAGTGAGSTITGSGATYNLTGVGAGNNGSGFSWLSFAKLTANGASTIHGVGGSLNGDLISNGTTVASGTIQTGGAQTYTGAVSGAAVEFITAGGVIDLTNPANNFTGAVSADTTNSGAAPAGNTVSITDANILIVGGITGSTVTLKALGTGSGAMIDDGVSGTVIRATALMLESSGMIGTGSANQGTALTLFAIPTGNVTVNASSPSYLYGPLGTLVVTTTSTCSAGCLYYNASTQNVAVGGAVATAQSAAIASASDAVAASFGTASIAQQIANGFAGEIGMSPPGIDNIVDEGIRMPEGQESEEENRRRR